MFTWFRAGLFAALIVFVTTPSPAAEKTFQDDALADAAISLEADLKDEAGTVTKPPAKLKQEAEALFKSQDLAGAANIYVQIVTVAPNDGTAWRRLADIWLLIPATEEDDGSTRIERARTAAYIAYQRSTTPEDESAALVTLANAFTKREEWRQALTALKLALDLHETPELKASYESLREKYGFRVSNFSVDSDAASPRACFQFSETLPKRTDYSPFVSVAGQDKPALSVDDQQICVEGLKHGDSYAITLRAGLPSTVGEDLLKDAVFNIYVRDRSPSVRLSGKAYVLPRTGQQGIPLITVNTDLIKVTIYRIGDRSLIDNVLGWEFQRNLYSYNLDEIADQKGEKVWTGELKVGRELNQEITTAFPIMDAVPTLEPGIYLLAARPGNVPGDDYGERTTQWFIVSDLGLTAFSGTDGIHAYVNSLASTAPLANVEIRLLARNNDVLAVKKTDANGAVAFEPGLARGEGGLSPALLIASGDGGDYAFLNLKQSAFDLTDRGVAGRDVPQGLDAFVFTERGVYRTGETVYVTTLLRDAAGVAVPNVDLTMVVDRPDGVEYRRSVVPDQGIGGRSLAVPIISSAPTGTWRVAVYSDPKGAAIGEVSFLVEDYVPDRLEFDLTTKANSISPQQPAELVLDGRFLYGAPAAGLDIEGEVNIAKAAERPGFPGYSFGLDAGSDEEEPGTESIPLADLPQTDEAGKASFTVALDQVPASTKPLEANVVVRLAEPGGRAIERRLALPVVPAAPMIGVKPLFSGKSLSDNDTASFDVVMVAPDGKEMAATGLKWQLLSIESKYQWYRSGGYWSYEPIKVTRRVADGTIDVAPGQPGKISVPVTWGRYRLEVASPDPSGPETTIGFDSGWYAESSADTPDLLEIALDKPEYNPGDTMTVAVTARSAGKVTLSVIGDRLITQTTTEVEPGLVKLPLEVGEDWGTGAYVLATLRRPLDEAEKRMPGRAIGVQWFSVDKKAHTIGVALDLPDLIRPETTLRIPIKLAGLSAGEEARVVVSAVDVGILNLTNYKVPAPDDYYLGQRKLSAEVRDLYGQLIDGMQGTKGEIRTGGDSGEGALQGSPPTQPPLAFYSGIVTVGPDGTAEVSFDIPAFTGTIRVMAAAWSKDQVGHGSGDVVVRDPVVVTATLPRFLLTGDRSTLRLDLDNVEGATGDYQIAVTADGPLSVEGGDKTVTLDAKKRGAVTLPVSAIGRRFGHGGDRGERARGLHARPQLSADGASGDADTRAPHGEAARSRPKHHHLGRRVRRSRAGHRQGRAVGDAHGGARRGDFARRARPLSARLHRADREPRAAAALCQRAVARRAARGRHRHRRAHRQGDRDRARPAGVRRRLRPVVAGRRRCLARCLCDGLSHQGPGTRLFDFRRSVQARARPLAQLREHRARRLDRWRAGAVLCALRARPQRHGAGGRPPLHRRRQARRVVDADRQGRDRRGARHAGRPRARREGVRRGARCAAGRPGIRRRSSRFRLAAARRRRGGHAGRRRRCAETDPGERHREDRDRAQQGDLHLDAGRSVAGARGPRAGPAKCEPHGQR